MRFSSSAQGGCTAAVGPASSSLQLSAANFTLCFSLPSIGSTPKTVPRFLSLYVSLQAYEHQAKSAAIQGFKRHTNMSLLISTSGTIKLWQARPLVLAHLHAWMGDSLHMTVYLLWWRWRRRALARLRFRAAIGLHMYRSA